MEAHSWFRTGEITKIYMFFYKETGVLGGYLTFQLSVNFGEKTMLVTEILYDILEELYQMLGFLYTYVNHYDAICFQRLPLFLDFLQCWMIAGISNEKRKCYEL